MWSGRVTALHAAVSGLIPGRAGICIKKISFGARKDGRAEPQSIVSVQNISELNPKSLRSEYGIEGICTVDSESSVGWGR